MVPLSSLARKKKADKYDGKDATMVCVQTADGKQQLFNFWFDAVAQKDARWFVAAMEGAIEGKDLITAEAGVAEPERKPEPEPADEPPLTLIDLGVPAKTSASPSPSPQTPQIEDLGGSGGFVRSGSDDSNAPVATTAPEVPAAMRFSQKEGRLWLGDSVQAGEPVNEYVSSSDDDDDAADPEGDFSLEKVRTMISTQAAAAFPVARLIGNSGWRIVQQSKAEAPCVPRRTRTAVFNRLCCRNCLALWRRNAAMHCSPRGQSSQATEECCVMAKASARASLYEWRRLGHPTPRATANSRFWFNKNLEAGAAFAA